jgi:hypothetical protein
MDPARGAREAGGLTFPTHHMGRPLVDLTKALSLAGELEDPEPAGGP